jgi:hypothetical protein
MLRSQTAWLIPLALTVISFGFNQQIASAEVTNNFDIKYNTLFTLVPRFDLGENIFRATITGESSDAAFGLSKFESNTYGKLIEATSTTQNFQFNANPDTFGLKNLPMLGDRYFGGSNELFGKAADMATVDFAAGTVMGGGTITLTGGRGIFNNASGQITFTQQDRLDPNAPPGTPVKGEAILKFSVQTPQTKAIPEPTSIISLALVAITTSLLLRQKNNRHLQK